MIIKYMSRMLITIIGIMFILYGIVWGMLGILGEKSTGLITDVRREMGELNIPKSGNYTYNISYSFELLDGSVVHGTVKEIRDGVYVKHQNTKATVRYLRTFPQINTLEQNTGFSAGNIVFIIIGVFLIFIVNNSKL